MVEEVTIKYGHFRVHPWRMKKVEQEKLSEEEIDYIVAYRRYYLREMHRWFCKKVLEPPK